MQAARPFPAGALMLLPMAPGHLQVVSESVHPHRVAVRAGGAGTVMEGYTMAFTFLGGTAHIECFRE